MIKIKIPQNLSLSNTLRFCNKIWELEDSDEYEFEFKNLGQVEPFSIAYIAHELKRFRNTKPNSKFTAKNYESKKYAAHMGLFNAFDIDFENNPTERTVNSSYVPLTIISVSELKKEALKDNLDIKDLVEKKSNEIAKLATEHSSGELLKILTFSIGEIMRNVVEHSESETIEYCAQYWPTKQIVEVCIFDTGTGILKGLSSNPSLEIADEKDALHLAILPEVSGEINKESSKDGSHHLGFGLHTISRICKDGGDFFLMSNNKCLFINGKEKHDIDCNYQGTAVRLRIDTSKRIEFSKMLNLYSKEGEDI